MAVAEQTIKKMRVDLPAWLHKEIRKEAAERELSMMQTAIGILGEYFEKRPGSKPAVRRRVET